MDELSGERREIRMNIENISKEKGEVLVKLSGTDLVAICNALYRQRRAKRIKKILCSFTAI